MANIDELLGINMPRASYALSGRDWASEPGDSAPMIINSHTPGVHGGAWATTYGASHDSFLSIVDGGLIEASIDGTSINGVYASMPNMGNDNIWSYVNGVQQIQYVVSGNTIEDGRSRVDSFGALADARGLCIRMPMMACGWGKTKDMLPLTGTTRQTPDSVKMDRGFWNAGTVDLRWDSKRNVWGGWNDLIADQADEGLGTAVFSTNPDDSEGFPYLKGRLQDVWWVRQTVDLDGTDGKVDGASSAKIMTHLEHYWYDDEEKGAAKLSSIFTIPHMSLDGEDDSACHKKGEENELGDELTGEGLRIDIKHDAHFFKELNVDGPIKFGDKLTDIVDEVACDDSARLSVNPKYYVGQMIFLDDDLPECGDDAPDAPAPGADTTPPCEWVPAVQIDECQLVGGHFSTLYGNDAALALKIDTLCTSISAYSETMQIAIEGGDAAAAGIGASAFTQIGILAACVTKGFADLAGQLDGAFAQAKESINSELGLLVEAIEAALQACGCEGASLGISPEVNFNEHGLDSPSCVAPKPPISSTSPIPKFDCDQCTPTQLQAPCANNADEGPFSHGPGCGGSSFVKADYEGVGEGQAHETIPPVAG